MNKCNSNNERIKRYYYEWQKEAKKKSPNTIDNIRKAINRYELATNYEDFNKFNKKKAVLFKNYFIQNKSTETKDYLSKSTMLSTVRHIKEFFQWLITQNGYKRIKISEIEYFNLSDKEIRIAQSPKRPKVPTIEQIRKVIFSMSTTNDIELRNRALISFTLLTGMRDSAIASLRLKHIKLNEELVEQLPAEVKTKFSKTIYTYFFSVGEDIKQIVIDWVNHLYKEKLFNYDNPVFPRTKMVLDKNNCFKADGVEPIHWETANKIRNIFKEAFLNAGLEYFSPHSFRNTLVRLGERLCKTPEDFKAWSQNLGHEQVLTTFYSYGHIEEYKQGEIIKNILKKQENEHSIVEVSKKLDILMSQNKKLDSNNGML